MMNFLPERNRNGAVITFLQGRCTVALGVLETALAGRAWLVGDGPTMAGFSGCSYLFYPEPFGFARSDWPGIDAWLTRICDQPGWAHPYDLMPGSPADRA